MPLHVDWSVSSERKPFRRGIYLPSMYDGGAVWIQPPPKIGGRFAKFLLTLLFRSLARGVHARARSIDPGNQITER